MSAEGGPIRILAVDDHPVVRQGIAGLVAVHSDMSLVAEASNGREAIHQFRAHHPDVTLMDLQMPEMGGVDAMIAIRGEIPEARIIVLTAYAGDAQVLRALKAGARGYLLKNSLHKELLETIRAVHAGKKALSAEASHQFAEHATDDALTPGFGSVPESQKINILQSFPRIILNYLSCFCPLLRGEGMTAFLEKRSPRFNSHVHRPAARPERAEPYSSGQNGRPRARCFGPGASKD